MSGEGARFIAAGFTTPKPLIRADPDGLGRSFVEHLIERFPRDSRFVFVARRDHLEETHLDEVLSAAPGHPEIVAIAPHKLGPVHAVVAASDAIDPTLPTIVNYCDFSFTWDPEHFLAWTQREHVDGAVVCYRDFHPHHRGASRYAYCRVDHWGRVQQVQEKQAFTPDPRSEWASTGTYFFRDGALALQRHEEHLAGGRTVNGEYYVSMVMDDMARAGDAVRVYAVDWFLQWGTPEDLHDWRYWRRAFDDLAALERCGLPAAAPGSALLMPMGGSGSRMAALGPSKPLLRLQGEPMFRLATALNAPVERRVYVVRSGDALEVEAATADDAGATVIRLPGPTDGQASSCDAASELLAGWEDGPLWISACDHGLAPRTGLLDQLVAAAPDVAVVGTRGFPPARHDVAAYSWLATDAAGPGELARVLEVGVKEAVSDEPARDPVLVGTLWFRSRRVYLDLLQQLLAQPPGVGGERHLDSIVPLALLRGLDVRLLEVPAWLCWGTPEALAEYRYWHRYFRGYDA